MSKTISLVTAALMLALGFAGAASAADATKAPLQPTRAARPSLQCSADANAKNLHGKERVAFRHDCMHKAARRTRPPTRSRRNPTRRNPHPGRYKPYGNT